MAIGEVLFLLWGIRVCLGVRNAESLYNEAKLISYAIYNIAFVNMLMVAIQLVLFVAILLQFMPIYKIYLYPSTQPFSLSDELTLSDRAQPQIHLNLLVFHLLHYVVYVTTSPSLRTVSKILSEVAIINSECYAEVYLKCQKHSLQPFFVP